MRDYLKALEAIEHLVGGDFAEDLAEDLEFLVYDKREKNVDPRLKQAAALITKIYMIAHAENSRGCNHPEWEKIKYEVLKEANTLTTPSHI